MGISRLILLFSECYKLAGVSGLAACFKFRIGLLTLEQFDSKSSVFLVGDSDA